MLGCSTAHACCKALTMLQQLRPAAADPMHSTPCCASSTAEHSHLQACLAGGNLFLVARASVCIGGNLTVAELLTRR